MGLSAADEAEVPYLNLVLRVTLSCSDLSLRHLVQELTVQELEAYYRGLNNYLYY